MPTLDRVPTDLVADDLIRTYERGTARLNDLVAAALRRGLDPSRAYTPNARRGDATAAYRRRQLTAANAVLEDLRRVGPRMAPVAVARAYASAAVSVDNVLRGAGVARPELVGQFGGLHQRAIQTMAANLERTLTAAVDRAGENLRTVFDRADAIEGALDPRTSAAPGVPFIGRRLDDPYRRVALEVLGERHVSLDTRRQMSSALTRRLIDEGATDAVTGFVDRAGRRWPLSRYATMVARTTTREATSRATIGRMRDHGADLVTISSHPHQADECTPYDGQTFSLSGDDDTYPVLDVMPPFHPQCLHVVTPADAGLEDFERELGLRAARPTRNVKPPRETARPPLAAPAPVTPPPVRAPRNVPTSTPAPEPMSHGLTGERAPVRGLIEPTTPAERPYVGEAHPRHDAGTAARLEAQSIRELIDRDPGAPAGYLEALERELGDRARGELRRTPYAALTTAQKRARTAELRDDLGTSGFTLLRTAEGQRRGLEDAYVAGRLSRADLEEELEDVWRLRDGREQRRTERERAAQFRRGAFPCFHCHRFKPRPSAVCAYCGADPVAGVNYAGGLSTGGDYWEKARELDREHNYDTFAHEYGDDTGRTYDPGAR